MSQIVPIGRQPLAADQNPAVVYLEGLASAASRRTMRAALCSIADVLDPRLVDQLTVAQRPERYRLIPWERLRYQHTSAIRARLMDSELAPATVSKQLCALRGVLKEAWRLGLMSAEDYQQARDVDGIKGDTLPAGRDIATAEIVALYDVCRADKSRAGRRDLALIALLFAGGLRRAELVKLDLANVDTDSTPDSGKLTVLGSKRRKDRVVFIAGGALIALRSWLAVRGDAPGALFWRIRKGDRMTQERLTAQAVYTILEGRGKAAGLNTFSPHDFRRTLAGNLLDQGVDIATVADILGHEDINTTRRYDRRPEEVKRHAAAKIRFPA